jgi:putative SOS response-associated peptidase YedK
MCGRYLRRSDKQKIAEAFRVANDLSEIVLPAWDYNVAPATFQPVIRLDQERGERQLALMRWGLVPFFAKSPKDFGYSTINAKAETLLTSRIYRSPLDWRRCLVPADGFYEWKVLSQPPVMPEPSLFELRAAEAKPKKMVAVEKQPYAFTLRSGEPFAFAGLWERWRDPEHRDAAPLETFTIITTEPNALTAEVHTRMPAILAPKDYAAWLEAGKDIRPPVELLRPFPAEEMQASKAHQDVGNVRNNRPELMICEEPLDLNSR